MSNINNVSGKKMQIRFSKQHVYQSNKFDMTSEYSFETQTNNIIDCARNLALNTDASPETVELYALMYCLGKTEYGEKGLNYINKNLPSNIPKITEAEIAYANLTTIFKDFETSIGMNNFKDFCSIYQREAENESLEIKILRLAIELERITEEITKSLLSNGNKDILAGVKVKLEEIRKIKETYKTTKKLELTPKLKELIQKIAQLYENYELSELQKEEIEKYVEDAVRNSKDRKALLNSIFSFKSNIAKKKVRSK